MGKSMGFVRYKHFDISVCIYWEFLGMKLLHLLAIVIVAMAIGGWIDEMFGDNE